jgi:two-component system OmpR family sensor kinase
MGRLFWKFFFAFFVAQLAASLVVGYAVSLAHDRQWHQPPEFRDGTPPTPRWNEVPPIGQRPGPTPREAGGPPRPPLPFLPVIVGLLGSLAASALLAWYFSRPIRHLRWALGEIAEGRFDTRVQQLMDGRRDELADLGREVDTTARKLDQLVTTQRRLLHDVSHELRSPLARIQAAIGLARQDAGKSEVTLERVERETVRLDALVGQLLALARLDAGTTTEPQVDLDVVDLLADVAQDARFEARAAGRDVDFDGEISFVTPSRAELLRRAMENVLRNAVKYTAEGTTVRVSAERTAEKRLRISVCDRGPGVPPSELASIFEPFRRVSGNAQEGFGLGLAIAKRAIETHGGTIQAENRPGGGLCIVIELPKQ